MFDDERSADIMRKNNTHRLLCLLLAFAFIIGAAGFAFAEDNIISDLLFNDPFENMIALTTDDIDATTASVAETVSTEELRPKDIAMQQLEEYKRNKAIQAQKTDRYIVKYKSDTHKQSVDTALQARVMSTNEIIGKDENRSKKTELIVLAEAVKPQDFANELRTMGIGDSIEYIQPDFKLVQQEITLDIVPAGSGATSGTGQISTGTLPIATTSVTVAVIDSGADVTHPMLKNYLWTGENGINGKNFVDDNHVLYDAENFTQYAHGTHVSGIIAQSASESGTPLKIMTCKAFENGSAYTSDVIEAIEFAVENGAKIINMSFGGTQYNPALEEAMAEADALFITAAGNHRMDVSDTPIYPACFDLDNIICVTSSNADKGFTYFSNYSTSLVDIAAPGRDIQSAYPNKGVAPNSGTSMAAAYVSGVAAAVAARNVTSVAQIKERILDTADRYEHLQNKIANGRSVNMLNALNNTVVTQVSTISCADDFDPISYNPTPEEQLELFNQKTIIDVSIGDNHTLMLANDGTVWAFGNSEYGKVGTGGNGPYYDQPQQVIGISNVIDISAGSNNSLALKSDGTVWGWGKKDQLGFDSTDSTSTPVQLSWLNNISLISTCGSHSLAYSSSTNTLYGWGMSMFGELMADFVDITVPSAIYYADGVTQIETAPFFSGLLFEETGKLFMFGFNGEGELKDGTFNNSITGTYGAFINAKYFDMGYDHILAITKDGDVYGWGSNYKQQLIPESTEFSFNTPQLIYDGSASSIACGYRTSFMVAGIMLNGWGSNENNALGTNGAAVDVLANKVFAGGHNAIYSSLVDGSLWVIGDNSNAQLGNTYMYPATFTYWVQIGSGYSYDEDDTEPQPQQPSYISASVTAYLTEGQDYYLIITEAGVNSKNGSYMINYDKEAVEIADFSALTHYTESEPTNIDSLGISVSDVLGINVPGSFVFSRSITVPTGMVWSGPANIIKFRAIKTGTTTITCT